MPIYKIRLPEQLHGERHYSDRVPIIEGEITAHSSNHALTMFLKRGENNGLIYYRHLRDRGYVQEVIEQEPEPQRQRQRRDEQGMLNLTDGYYCGDDFV